MNNIQVWWPFLNFTKKVPKIAIKLCSNIQVWPNFTAQVTVRVNNNVDYDILFAMIDSKFLLGKNYLISKHQC